MLNHEYHKIPTLFKRDEKGKKFLVGKFTDETVEYLQNNQWVFTEKVDGMNIRVYWDGHTVTFYGRTDNAQLPGDLVNHLNTTFGGEVNAQMFEQKFGEVPVLLFGEGYGAGVQKGSGHLGKKSFILFDVQVGGTFIQRDGVEDIARYFNIPVVPVLLIGTIAEGVKYTFDNEHSKISPDAPLEGLVGRPVVEVYDRRGRRVIVKIKRRDFDDAVYE